MASVSSAGSRSSQALSAILLQQALAFQAASYTLANQLDQFFQLALGWRLNALKAGRMIVATHVDAVQEQDMEPSISPCAHPNKGIFSTP